MNNDLLTSNYGTVRKQDLTEVFKSAGVNSADLVMVHAGLFVLGRPAEGIGKEAFADAFIDALLQVVGKDGLVIFPTFTLSVCKSGIFDPKKTKSEMGLLSERARTRFADSRTHHPFFSVVILGENRRMFDGINLNTCFGENSFFQTLHTLNETGAYKGKVKFLMIGIDPPPEAITYIHSIEEKMAVPYRYHKEFQGTIQSEDINLPYNVSFFVRDLMTDVVFDAEACWDVLKNDPSVKIKRLGNSFVSMLPESTIYNILVREITARNDFLCKGGYRKP